MTRARSKGMPHCPHLHHMSRKMVHAVCCFEPKDSDICYITCRNWLPNGNVSLATLLPLLPSSLLPCSSLFFLSLLPTQKKRLHLLLLLLLQTIPRPCRSLPTPSQKSTRGTVFLSTTMRQTDQTMMMRARKWNIKQHLVLTGAVVASSLYSSWVCLVSAPDTTYERGSGDIWLIPRASLTLITFRKEISLHQSHCRKHNM